MKKIFTILITLLLVFNGSLILSVSANQSDKNITNALMGDVSTHNTTEFYYNDPTLYQENYYATYYYKNLSSNFGLNVKGSCTYVAFAMLLSYYDTYWNDSIIPEGYDMVSMLSTNSLTTQAESPGIYAENSSIVSIGISTDAYNQVI